LRTSSASGGITNRRDGSAVALIQSTKTAFFVFTPPPPLELSDLSRLEVEHFEEFMVDVLFDQPWWLPTSIIILGVALFISGNRRQLLRLRNTGAALVIAALVLVLVSLFVETDKEKCLRQTHELINSVVAADWNKFSSLLDSHVTLGLVSATIYSNQQDLLKGAQDGTQTYGLKAVHVLSMKAKQTQSLITIDMKVVTEQESTMGRPLPSSWELQWEQTETGWKLDRLTCLQIDDMNLDEMNSRFPR
jgi:hypothetical protein